MEISEEERKRLLHAYETIMFRLQPIRKLQFEELEIARCAWGDIKTILRVTTVGGVKEICHGQGEWDGVDLYVDGHLESIK